MFPIVVVGKRLTRLLRARVSRKCLCRKINQHVRDYNLFPTMMRTGVCRKIPAQLKEK